MVSQIGIGFLPFELFVAFSPNVQSENYIVYASSSFSSSDYYSDNGLLMLFPTILRGRGTYSFGKNSQRDLWCKAAMVWLKTRPNKELLGMLKNKIKTKLEMLYSPGQLWRGRKNPCTVVQFQDLNKSYWKVPQLVIFWKRFPHLFTFWGISVPWAGSDSKSMGKAKDEPDQRPI